MEEQIGQGIGKAEAKETEMAETEMAEKEMAVVEHETADTGTDKDAAEKAKRDFLTSYDFMKLGQALNHENWQIAAMTVQRMQRNVQGLGFESMERQLANIRQCIIHKQGKQAKDILAIVVAGRGRLLK